MPRISNAKIQAGLDEMRARVNQPYPDVDDWDHLMDLLSTVLCEHEWETKTSVGAPDQPAEIVIVCKACGAEADE